jgi:hypothetical protein
MIRKTRSSPLGRGVPDRSAQTLWTEIHNLRIASYELLIVIQRLRVAFHAL